MPRVEPWLGLCLLCACERGASAPSEQPSSGPALATVTIAAAVVREIARERGVPLERARELAEEDALLAAELQRQAPALASWLERLVLARELSEALLVDAERGGPPTDQEVEQLTSERWWELDRPRMVQVVHAVVMSEDEDGAAAALARQIAGAVANASSEQAFREVAKAVPAHNQKVRVEQLPPVTQDGRALDLAKPPPLGPPVHHFAAEFAAAAQRLERVGQISPVVRSPFGYHVLFAQRIVEPRQPSLEERRKLVAPEVFQRRALAEQGRLLVEQRQQSAPQQERSALRSIAQLAVRP